MVVLTTEEPLDIRYQNYKREEAGIIKTLTRGKLTSGRAERLIFRLNDLQKRLIPATVKAMA